MSLSQLAEPFAPNDIEWRIGQAGVGNKGVWAKVLAYVTNRAIMQRLDDVCGPENWRNEYRYEANGAVLCGISIFTRVPDREPQWVTKWDGAENTDIEAVKGGLSNAMKRCGVQWGIGRYLYDLEEGWATVGENEQNYAPGKADSNGKKGYPPFRWSPPKLPAWAQPGFTETKPVTATTTTAKPKRDVFANSINKAKDVEVRGRKLADHTTDELRVMQDKLRAEGSSKHKDLLGSVVLVLSERPVTDDDRVAAMHRSANADDAGLALAMK